MARPFDPPRGFNSAHEYLERQREALKGERSTFDDHYRDLSEFVQPRRGRFSISDRNKGDRRHHRIINSKATWALGVAVAGLTTGLTSPSRPWLKYEHPDPDLNEYKPVQMWIADRQRRAYRVFSRSNFYNMVPVMYEELLLFGTGAMTHDADPLEMSRFYAHTVGSYAIAQNGRGVVDHFVREAESTTWAIVDKFGLENVSLAVRRDYDVGNYHNWHPVVRFLEPNPEYDPTRPASKAFRSTYYEPGGDKDKMLRVGGYYEFPVYVPRWAVTGEDIYGTNCPGMTALGDVRGLQIEERRKAQAIDKMVSPPLAGPGSLRNVQQAHLPGGYVGYNDDPSRAKFGPLYQVEPRVRELMMDIQSVEQRINDAFYVDLFKAISEMEGVQPRNELELIQRKEEQLLLLGPVLEHLYDTFLDPCVDRVFNMIERSDPDAPPPPPELEGEELNVEYISILSQAQRAVATKAIERAGLYIGSLAEASGDISVWDKFDKDEAIDEYTRLVGVPPRLIRGDRAVKQIRDQRAEQQRQEQTLMQGQAASEIAQKGAGAIKQISEVGAS